MTYDYDSENGVVTVTDADTIDTQTPTTDTIALVLTDVDASEICPMRTDHSKNLVIERKIAVDGTDNYFSIGYAVNPWTLDMKLTRVSAHRVDADKIFYEQLPVQSDDDVSAKITKLITPELESQGFDFLGIEAAELTQRILTPLPQEEALKPLVIRGLAMDVDLGMKNAETQRYDLEPGDRRRAQLIREDLKLLKIHGAELTRAQQDFLEMSETNRMLPRRPQQPRGGGLGRG